MFQRYRDELEMAKLFPGLDISLGNEIRGQILGGDTVPSLSTILSRVCCVFMGDDSSSGVSSNIENFAMVVVVLEVEDMNAVVAVI